MKKIIISGFPLIKADNVYVYNDNTYTYKALMILFDRLQGPLKFLRQ